MVHTLTPIPYPVIVELAEATNQSFPNELLLLIAEYTQWGGDQWVHDFSVKRRLPHSIFGCFVWSKTKRQAIDCETCVNIAKPHENAKHDWEWQSVSSFLIPEQDTLSPPWMNTLKSHLPWLKTLPELLRTTQLSYSKFLWSANLVQDVVDFFTMPIGELMFDECYLHWNQTDWKKLARLAAKHSLEIACG